MQFEFWQVLILTTMPPILAGAVTWVLNRRAAAARAQVENDSTAVDTITDVLNELRAELSRARAEVSRAREDATQAAAALRSLASELTSAARAIERHRSWDEERVLDGAPHPPALPKIPHWWEIMDRVRPTSGLPDE